MAVYTMTATVSLFTDSSTGRLNNDKKFQTIRMIYQ